MTGYRGAMEEEQPRRGRPQVHDTERMRSAAIAVLARRGYNETTMKELSTELGVGRRTLHRHFPTKADLVWGSLDDTFVGLHRRLADAPADRSTLECMKQAIVDSFDSGVEEADAGRLWFELIAATPELRSAQTEAIAQWRVHLSAFARERLEGDELAAVALASAVQGATLAALEWWATHQDGQTPSASVARAIDALRDL